ncbi:MAG TPA: acetate kinase [Candidatus Deferrimicrobium sp.]|nr:acetate kinase [Candidatus Deferrimicrobium sp.]
MKVLVINSGSSSIKFQLINMETRQVLARGLLERIGIKGSVLNYYKGDEKKVIETSISNHEEGVKLIVDYLTDPVEGVIKDKNEIYAIGHRVVHAGEKFSGTVIITEEVVDALKECIPLAPLHNPPNIIGIEAAQRILPGIPMAGAFDTAFHQTMPEKAYIYALPFSFYEKYKIRRYGFHGTSHFFVAKQGSKEMGKTMKDLKIITCHLGNGSSMAAIEHGKSIDTSMGFTPLEGLVMGTRCGDIDPAIPTFLQKNENLSVAQLDDLLNKQCGVKGLSGVSPDMRDIEQKVKEGHHGALLALEVFAYRIKKYIGSYIAAMNGVDLIIFTGGIGERDLNVRKKVLENMEFMGIEFDNEANQKAFGVFGLISTPHSKVKVMVVPTNEELEIAEQTVEVLKKNK